ncbi:hypothetical protein C9374_006202 [Naegleria lovaniensis]|uniref:Uncharacterized protein n=1 Tax=Naegleria lovaniensis TaxID=51637 RepID=A0AA88GNN4_NAELO|nr:uncharacterized protein C9374_006202 [Naegleria lovaniensis]KAG2381818.1 hypothetical protein C9374_006202 [Naegleria lovaniensis]
MNAKNPKLGLKKSDIDFFHFCVKNNIPYTVVVTKVDNAKSEVLNEIAITLRHLLLRELKELKLTKSVHITPTIFFTSSKKRKGISEIRNYIASLSLNFESRINIASSDLNQQAFDISTSNNNDDMVLFGADEEDDEPIAPLPIKTSKDTKKTIQKEKDNEKSEELNTEKPVKSQKKQSVNIAAIPIGALAQKNKYVQRAKHLDDSVKRNAKQLKSYGDIVKYHLRTANRKKK